MLTNIFATCIECSLSDRFCAKGCQSLVTPNPYDDLGNKNYCPIFQMKEQKSNEVKWEVQEKEIQGLRPLRMSCKDQTHRWRPRGAEYLAPNRSSVSRNDCAHPALIVPVMTPCPLRCKHPNSRGSNEAGMLHRSLRRGSSNSKLLVMFSARCERNLQVFLTLKRKPGALSNQNSDSKRPAGPSLSFTALFPGSHFQTPDCNSSWAPICCPRDRALPWAAAHMLISEFLEAHGAPTSSSRVQVICSPASSLPALKEFRADRVALTTDSPCCFHCISSLMPSQKK